MNIFKAGDKVFLTKPKDVWEGPSWNDRMDEYLGREVTIDNYINDEGRLRIKEDDHSWVWYEPWLTLAEPFEGNV